MDNVLITGGTGYIGSTLADHLVQKGYKVTITGRQSSQIPDVLKNRVECRYIDLLDNVSINGACRGMDIIIHTASFDERLSAKEPKTALLANGYATRLLLEDSNRENVKDFVYLSTFHVYGKGSGTINENTPVCPISDYAITHYLGEMYCQQFSRQSKVNTTIVRITNGYGAPIIRTIDKWHLVLHQFCLSAFKKRQIEIKSGGGQMRDFISIKDISTAIETLIEPKVNKQSGEIYNISSEQAISIRCLAEKVAEIYEKKYNRPICIIQNAVSDPETIQAQDALIVHSEKLRSLNWQPSQIIDIEIDNIFSMLEKWSEADV